MLFSCSTNTSSMPAAFLFFSVAMPVVYSAPEKGNSSAESSSLIGDNLRRGLCWYLSWAVDEQLVCNLVSSGQTMWFWSSWIIRDRSDCLPYLLFAASQISLCDHLFPSPLVLYCHLADQLVTSNPLYTYPVFN